MNAFKNMATVSITFLGIFVLSCFQVELREDALNFLSPKKGSEEKQIRYKDINKMFSFMFFKRIFAKMRVNEISIFNSVGKKDDAFVSCMASGWFLCFAHSFLSVMQTKKGDYVQNVGSIVDSDADCFKLSGFCSVKICLFNIILCFILAILQKLKSRSGYGKKN